MDCPRTDEDWEKLAECIVTKMPSVSPEVVGGYSVEATATIFSWYKGDERRRALDKRQYARERLMDLGKQVGCVSEAGPTGYYWEVTNMATREILQLGTRFESIGEAVKHAKKFLKKDYQHYGDNDLVIKVFAQSPDERIGFTYAPEYTESYWVGGAARAEEVLEGISQPLDAEPAPYRWKIWDWATGEIYEEYEYVGKINYYAPQDAMSGAKAFLEANEDFRREYIMGRTLYSKGFQIKVVCSKGVEVPGYDEWYTPSWAAETPSRPFPQTYGDWVNLAEDIKAKCPDDPVTRASVNYQLQMIAEEEQYTRPPDEQAEAVRAANDAKRWLAGKAGELGIT